MFRNAKVGDWVWSMTRGWGTVVTNKDGLGYPLHVKFDGGTTKTFDLNGREFHSDLSPILFWDEVNIVPPPRPKRKARKVVEGWLVLWPSDAINVVANPSCIYPTREEVLRVCEMNHTLGGEPLSVRIEYEEEVDD